MLSHFSCVQFFVTPSLCPPGSSVHGILQARILEWIALPSSRGSSQPRDQTQISCSAGRFFTWGPSIQPAASSVPGVWGKGQGWSETPEEARTQPGACFLEALLDSLILKGAETQKTQLFQRFFPFSYLYWLRVSDINNTTPETPLRGLTVDSRSHKCLIVRAFRN